MISEEEVKAKLEKTFLKDNSIFVGGRMGSSKILV